jgi:alanine dehydrogenase
MHFDDYVRVVEEAFGLHGEGKTLKPGMMHIDATDGEFHIKAGSLGLSKPYFALKANGGFFHNMERFGDAERPGSDSALRRKRTGASTAVAAKYLARVESEVVTICGCGTQGRAQLLVMHSMFAIKKAYVLDIVADKAESLARELSQFLEIAVVATANLREAARESDTASPARRRAANTLAKDYVSPGTFIAAMGADSPHKQELRALKSNKVVVDVLQQCARRRALPRARKRHARRRRVR